MTETAERTIVKSNTNGTEDSYEVTFSYSTHVLGSPSPIASSRSFPTTAGSTVFPNVPLLVLFTIYDFTFGISGEPSKGNKTTPSSVLR